MEDCFVKKIVIFLRLLIGDHEFFSLIEQFRLLIHFTKRQQKPEAGEGPKELEASMASDLRTTKCRENDMTSLTSM